MGFLDRFRKSPEPEPEPSSVTDDDVRQAARDMTLPGFRTKDDVVVAVGEYLEIEGDPRVVRIVDEVWSQRLSEEAQWDGPGEYARVAAAFEALDAQGVVARMSFTCCQTCGTTEIDDERTALPDVAEGDYAYREWGYAFFHEQDAERLADEPATLWLSYSTFTPAPDVDPSLLERWRAGDESLRREVIVASDRAVGERIATALREQGLDVSWDGDTGQRIAVDIAAWRKPLPR